MPVFRSVMRANGRVHPMDVNVLPSINKGSFLSFSFFPETFKKSQKHLENTFELFPKFSKSFINRFSSSKTGFKRFRSFRKFAEISELFPKFPYVFRRLGMG